MARISVTLLMAALLHTATAMPLDERQYTLKPTPSTFSTGLPTGLPTSFPTANPSSPPPGLPTDLPTVTPTSIPDSHTALPGTGYPPVPTGYPVHHPDHPGHEGDRPIRTPEKRNLPVTPKWLRWLPFENINM
ncbi:hypothetical protein F4808DRAFT_9856 [Astrocystis sublimbata]|nr:hypothetical protein F4808DRAFT_9856 [Astrocystis sublimbata]